MSIRLASLGALAAMILAAGIAAGGWPTTAHGFIVGRYQVEACTEAVGFQNNSWTVSTNNSDLETHTSCGEPPAPYQSTTIANLELTDIVGLAEELPVGAEGAWQVLAPAGATIAEVTGYSSLFRNGGDAWQVYRESEATNGEITVEQTCKGVHTDSCGIGGLFQATALHARRFAFGALCEAEEYEPGKFFTTCPDGALLHDVRAGINYATVTLEDPTPPSAVTVSGIPSGAQHGTITIHGSATDTIAGLLSLSIINDSGQTVAGPVSAGSCDYSKLTPCPTSANDLEIPLDTENLPEGENQLRLIAVNAAHDETLSTPFTIDVENHPAGPPTKPGKNGGGNEEPSGTPSPPAGQPPDSSSGGGSTSNSSKGNGTSTTTKPQPTALSTLKIHLDKPRLQNHWLTITGSTPANAHGLLHITIKLGTTHSARNRSAAIVRGRFSLRIKLGNHVHPHSVTLKTYYAGSPQYRPSTMLAEFALPK